MKNTIIITTIAMFWIGAVSVSNGFSANPPADTIEVNFGDKGKILIHVESKEDLEALKQYDLNSMLEDIVVPGEGEINENEEKVILEDAEGTRYLKENVEEEAEFRKLENEFSSDSQGSSDAVTGYTERPKKRFSGSKTTLISGFDWGINNYLEDGKAPSDNNEQYAVRPWGSWYIGLMPTFQTHVGGVFAINYGAGISWYNFKFQDPRTRLVEGENGIQFEQWDVELQSSKSKLTVGYLNAHFLPVLDFGYKSKKRTYDDGFVQKRTRYQRNGFRIGAGGYVGTRIDSYQKLVWRGTGNKSKLRERDNFYLENLRYGARFLLGYGEVDLFVNYDLNQLFAKDKGPELNTISIGFSF